jgi:hypothetical protein
LTLDRDGTSFWAADFCTSDVFRFDLASGKPLAKFNTGTPTQTVFGIAMRGAPPHPAPAGPLVASPPSATVVAGQSARFTLTFTPNPAVASNTFSFSCSNLPVGANCTFASGGLAAGSITTTLTITTTGRFQASLPGGSAPLERLLNQPATVARLLNRSLNKNLPLYGLWLPLGGLVLVVSGAGRRRAQLAMLFALVLALILMVQGCGGGGGSQQQTTAPSPSAPPPGATSSGTPLGAYTVIVSAAGGSVASSTAVALTVQ